jgi:hypothetical protein
MAAYQGGQRSGRGKRKAPARPTASKPSDKRTNLPGGRSKPKPKPSAAKPQRQGPPVPARLTKAPPAPKLPAPTRMPVARPAAKPKPTPKPKAPAKAKPPAASKPTVAQTSGIGPVKSGAEYASKKQAFLKAFVSFVR